MAWNISLSSVILVFSPYNNSLGSVMLLLNILCICGRAASELLDASPLLSNDAPYCEIIQINFKSV